MKKYTPFCENGVLFYHIFIIFFACTCSVLSHLQRKKHTESPQTGIFTWLRSVIIAIWVI